MSSRRNFNIAVLKSLAAAAVWPLAGCAAGAVRSRPLPVDSHAHVFMRDLPMPDRRRAPSGYDAPPEDYLRVLEENGIARGVLVQPSFLGTDNTYLVAALRKFSDRFRGIAVVPPAIGAQDLDALQAAGVVGIRLNQIGLPPPDYHSPQWQQLLREVKARNWQIEIHQVAGKLEPLMAPLLDAGVLVVVDHMGRPDPKLGVDDPGFGYLLDTAKTGRVYVKLSAAYRNGDEGRGEAIALSAVPLLKQSFGLDRLVWASDWPHTLFEKDVRYARQLSLLSDWLPSAADRQVVLVDTPATLFGFGG